MTRRLYSLNETAEQLNVGKTKIEELVRDGHLESVVIGRRRLVPAECIDEYVARLRRAS